MRSLPDTKSFKLGVFVAGLESISAISLIAVSAFLISRASEQPPVLYLMMAVVGVRAFALGRAFFRYVQRLALHDSTFTHVSRIRPLVFAKLAELSPGIQSGSSGKSLARVMDQVDELQNFPIRVFAPLLQAGVAALFGSALIAGWFPTSAIATLLLALVAFGLSQLLTSALASKSEQVRFELNNQLRSELVEYLESVKVLKAYGWSERFRERIYKTANAIDGIDSRASIAFGVSGSLFPFVAVTAASISGFLAAFEIGEVPGYLLALAVLTPLAIFELVAMAGNSQISFARFRSAKADLDALIEGAVPTYLQIQDGEGELSEFKSLKVEGDVDFGTKRVPLPAFELEQGDFVALMGESGVGKSTLANLMCSLYSTTGTFEINNQPATSYKLSSRRRMISLCEQQPQIFSGSIAENLAVSGVEDRSTQGAVLETLGLYSEIEDRGGLELRVGEQGDGLSGGQLQRLAIARALLAGAQLLVLDEPTSGLDWDNALRLIEHLSDINKLGITILIITHDEQLAALAKKTVRLTT